MKKLTQSILLITLALAGALAQAHPGGYGGGYGRSYGHEGHGGGWSRGGWVAPVVAAGLIGGAIYAGTHPVYVPNYVSAPVVINPAPLYLNGVPGSVAPVAYYCPAYQQYYPQVGSCPVPWQIIN
jgi:hypothetical protein